MTMRLRLAVLSLFLAGVLAGALGPHCAAMFVGPATAAPHAAHAGHGGHRAAPTDGGEAPCAAMSMPDAVLAEASAPMPPRMLAVPPATTVVTPQRAAGAPDARRVRPPWEPPPDPAGLTVVRTHRLLI